MQTVQTVADLRLQVATWRAAGQTIALVPTMGALHEGHLTLARNARNLSDRVVVTLFVNPAQFGENEDLDTYPRDTERDSRLLVDEGADLLFMPDVAEMYPDGDATRVHVGDLGTILEAEHRPGFLIGVATVVTKLLLQALPDVALFGEKDYQQLQVIRRMVADLHIPVEISGLPTVRDDDGLALSSRNACLSAEERVLAPKLHSVLNCVAKSINETGDIAAALNAGKAALLSAGFSSVDYLTCRHADTLADMSDAEGIGDVSLRVLVAARLGKTRLIDNIAVPVA